MRMHGRVDRRNLLVFEPVLKKKENMRPSTLEPPLLLPLVLLYSHTAILLYRYNVILLNLLCCYIKQMGPGRRKPLKRNT